MSISRIFDLSRRSLSVYQQALGVTANNISNSANPDYSRQQVTLKTERPELTGGFVWGTGVTMGAISRVRNSLTDMQIRANNSAYSNNNKQNILLGQIESQFSEPSELGIAHLMGQFFNAWDELAVTPNSMPLRYNIIRNAEKLSSKVQNVYESMDLTKADIINEIKSKTALLNNHLKQVQILNAQIFEFQAVGQNANDLMDRRDKVIDELSKLANINVSYDNGNSASISVGGAFGADRANVSEFKVAEVNGKITVVTEGTNLKAILNGGELSALADVYSVDIPKYQSALDEIFSTFVEQVNSIHSSGYTLGSSPSTGIKFFGKYENGRLIVNQDLKDDPSKIASSEDGTAGSGGIALKIAALSSQALIGNSTLLDKYSSLISEIGSKKVLVQKSAESYEMVLQQLDTLRASYSGVSVDEEMANIIKYQRSYEASAKMIKIADELLQTILNMV